MKAKRFCQCGTELERSRTKDGRAARWPKYCSPECQAEAYKINQPTAVYILANASGEPLYVGVSGNLKQRMIAHKATKDWWESVANIDFEDFTNRLEAEVREAELIKALKPLHNRAVPIDPTSTPDATDGMNRVLVVFSDGLLSELDSARGLVSRSAWIRQAVEDKLMKEAVAPLVPESTTAIQPWTDEEWKAFQEGAGFETPEETEILDRMHGITPEPETITVKRIRGRKLLEEQVPKPKARRKKSVKDSGASNPSSGGTKRGDGIPQSALSRTESPSLPARCNRGACTGTIKPNGHCMICNQRPRIQDW